MVDKKTICCLGPLALIGFLFISFVFFSEIGDTTSSKPSNLTELYANISFRDLEKIFWLDSDYTDLQKKKHSKSLRRSMDKWFWNSF